MFTLAAVFWIRGAKVPRLFAPGSESSMLFCESFQVRKFHLPLTTQLCTNRARHITRLRSSDPTCQRLHDVRHVIVLQILRTVETPDMVLSSIAMSHSGRMLFTGTSAGSIRSMKFPLTVPGEWTDYPAHCAVIVKVITYWRNVRKFVACSITFVHCSELVSIGLRSFLARVRRL